MVTELNASKLINMAGDSVQALNKFGQDPVSKAFQGCKAALTIARRDAKIAIAVSWVVHEMVSMDPDSPEALVERGEIIKQKLREKGFGDKKAHAAQTHHVDQIPVCTHMPKVACSMHTGMAACIHMRTGIHAFTHTYSHACGYTLAYKNRPSR